MALSGSQVTRLGLYGGSRAAYARAAEEQIGGGAADDDRKRRKDFQYDLLNYSYELPEKEIEKVSEKVQAYVEAEEEITEEAIFSITETLADLLPKAEVKRIMKPRKITEPQAIAVYKEAVREFIRDEELALILIFASL